MICWVVDGNRKVVLGDGGGIEKWSELIVGIGKVFPISNLHTFPQPSYFKFKNIYKHIKSNCVLRQFLYIYTCISKEMPYTQLESVYECVQMKRPKIQLIKVSFCSYRIVLYISLITLFLIIVYFRLKLFILRNSICNILFVYLQCKIKLISYV